MILEALRAFGSPFESAGELQPYLFSVVRIQHKNLMMTSANIAAQFGGSVPIQTKRRAATSDKAAFARENGFSWWWRPRL